MAVRMIMLVAFGILTGFLVALTACGGDPSTQTQGVEEDNRTPAPLTGSTATPQAAEEREVQREAESRPRATNPSPTRTEAGSTREASPAATAAVAGGSAATTEPGPTEGAPTEPGPTEPAAQENLTAAMEECRGHFRQALLTVEEQGPLDSGTLEQLSAAMLAANPQCAASGWTPEFAEEAVCKEANFGGQNVELPFKIVRSGRLLGLTPSAKAETGSLLVHFAKVPYSEAEGCWSYSAYRRVWHWWQAIKPTPISSTWEIEEGSVALAIPRLTAPPAPARPPVANPTGDTDRQALTALFQLSDGEKWDITGTWAGHGELDTWEGVETDGNGRVTRLTINAHTPVAMELNREAMAHLRDLSELKELSLHGFWLTEGIAPELGHLRQLEKLFINGGITGEIPSELATLSNLKVISLTGDGQRAPQITGPLPPELATLSDLEELIIQAHGLSGPIPPGLFTMESLRRLELRGNQLSETLPAQVSNTKISRLDLASNSLTGEIPPEVDDTLAGIYADLRGNTFTGCISDALAERNPDMPVCDVADPGDLRTLVAIHRAWGSPSSLDWGTRTPMHEWAGITTNRAGRVVNLDFEDVRTYEIYGYPLPGEIGNLTELQELNLAANGLRGELPPSLGNLTKLRTMNLRGNSLTGDIPDSFAGLAALTEIYLEENQMTISFPNALLNLENLERVDLWSYSSLRGGNRVTGCVPANLRDVFDGVDAC